MRLLCEPLFTSVDKDATDMKLLWVYTTQTFNSFSTTGGSINVDDILRIKVVQHAFQVPFLMNTILGLAAMHLKHLNQSVSPTREIAYHARAFEGYRKAIAAAEPDAFPALLACSLFLCALSTDLFRGDQAKPFYILEWMTIWKGINLIISISKETALWESGMKDLFYRPPIDLNEAAQHIPNNLLFMITSIKEDDPDYENREIYYKTLKYLGSLYQELPNGWSTIMILRVITYFTFLPRQFFPIAQARRPRALVIIAHYLAFAKTVDDVWWMQGISDREIHNICNLLGEEWAPLLRVPRMAVNLTDKNDIAKLLLDNYTWEPPEDALVTRPASEMALIDNDGKPIKFIDHVMYAIPMRERAERSITLESYANSLLVQGKITGEVAQSIEEDSGSLGSGRSPSTLSTNTPSADGSER